MKPLAGAIRLFRASSPCPCGEGRRARPAAATPRRACRRSLMATSCRIPARPSSSARPSMPRIGRGVSYAIVRLEGQGTVSKGAPPSTPAAASSRRRCRAAATTRSTRRRPRFLRRRGTGSAASAATGLPVAPMVEHQWISDAKDCAGASGGHRPHGPRGISWRVVIGVRVRSAAKAIPRRRRSSGRPG